MFVFVFVSSPIDSTVGLSFISKPLTQLEVGNKHSPAYFATKMEVKLSPTGIALITIHSLVNCLGSHNRIPLMKWIGDAIGRKVKISVVNVDGIPLTYKGEWLFPENSYKKFIPVV